VKKILVLATGFALLAAFAAPPAIDAQAVQTVPNAPAVLVARGAEVDGSLQQPISSKLNHNGDRFTLAQTDTFWHHKPQLKGAIIDGHVENVSPAGPAKKATLSLVFDDITLADGSTVPLSAQLISLKEVEPQTHKIRDTGIILGSAFTGHLVSKNTGKNGGTLAGAAAGVALVATLKDDIKVKRGTVLRLKLLKPIVTGG
jgi:hypothetical protein